jgi:hypothetical protein
LYPDLGIPQERFMKTLALGLVAALTLATAAVAAPNTTTNAPRSGSNSPTATHDNPSSCLGAERATRNSNGGDREHGLFGPAQAAFVAAQRLLGINYGEFLGDWKADCQNPPGNDDDAEG